MPILKPDDHIANLSNPHYCRGYLINEFSLMEKAIELFIVIHMDKDYTVGSLSNYTEILMSKLTFETKVDTLKEILEKNERAKGFKKTKNNTYPHNSFIEELKLLSCHVYRFEHYINYDKLPAPENKIIGFIEFRNSSEIIWYDQEEILNLIQTIHYINEVRITKLLLGMVI